MWFNCFVNVFCKNLKFKLFKIKLIKNLVHLENKILSIFIEISYCFTSVAMIFT